MKNNDIIGVGKRIAELRRANKMTQEALADKLDVTPKHISHVERDCASLSLNNLVKICDLFGCNLDYLIRGTYKDKVLSKIPLPIIQILNSNDTEEISRLSQYLNIYSELYSKSKKNT